MRHLRPLGLLLGLSCWLAHPAAGQTYSPRRILGRYQQAVWQDQHGLPQNGLSTVVQTTDGYLWLATAEGVVRFDGARFTVFDTANTSELKSNNIASLLADRAGALWVCYGNGLNRYKDGRFTFYGKAQGLPDERVVALFEDRAGNLWLGTNGGGLSVYRDGRFAAYTTRDGLPDNRVTTFAEDAEGGLWVGTLGGLARFKDGKFTVYSTRDGLASDRVGALYWDRAGTLWVGTENSGVSRLQAGRFSNAGLPAGLQRHHVQAIAEDREGSLWFGVRGGGLYRLRAGRFDACTEQDGLANNVVQAIYPAANGDLWLGTSGSGLVQLRDGLISTYSVKDGLPHEMVGAVCGDGAGNLWVSTRAGLSRFKDGQVTVMGVRDGISEGRVRALNTDSAGNLLASTPSGQVLRYWGGRFTPYGVQVGPTTLNLLEDRAGKLWAGTVHDGLFCYDGGQVTTYNTQNGLPDNYVAALFEDSAGNLWVGTGNGLSRLRAGEITTWTDKNGFPGRRLFTVYEDRAGQIWLGTDGDGLIRFKAGRFTAITTKDGLYDNLAFRILEDDRGNLWLSGNKGIYRASLQELNDFADGRIRAVNSFAYGTADGMLSRECNGAHPAGWKTPDGKLWFPTIKGVVAVDPQKLDHPPPHVTIEQVLLDGKAQPTDQPIEMRPGQENLEIHYSALSWHRPSQLKFKYQLVGLDQGWTEAGTRRTAYYPHPAPGKFTFRVIADNGEGVWNTTGQSLRIIVLPPFYRTWWFNSLALLGGIGLVWLGYRARVAQLQRQQAAQEEFSRRLIESQESERKRIAAELHDSLGQSLAMIKNRALYGSKVINDLPTAKDYFAHITDETATAISEVREIAHNLRPYLLDRLGLTKALQAMLRKVEETCDFELTVQIAEVDHLFAKEAEMSIYRIVQEGLNNIIKHAAATRVSVIIRKEEGALVIVLQDDGKGFHLAPAHADGSQHGFGLLGMTERVRMLGGHLTIQSAPGQGATITIRIGYSSGQL